MSQHGDEEWEISPHSYRRFLVETPLIHVSREEDPQAPACGYGSFHHQYRIDGKLVAVGVVDILPRCLSSKYFFWDPDYAHLALGKFSAIKEIEWVQEVSKTSPQLQYYYMGYYIHSCHKMRYKAGYQPSQLLCPLRFSWVHIDDAVNDALDRQKYCVLSELDASKSEISNGSFSNQSGKMDEFCLQQRGLREAVPKHIIENTKLENSQIGKMTFLQLQELGILIHPEKFVEAVREWHRLSGPAAERIVLQI
eukprot:TRINITY_DN28773_c0_g1_i6.p2 TRINITY_DN28773_c0_g1~~TRINITY_DN28773_c0_g1_i6.p2  ORF type:complete len:252 (-),score=35.97 TRINITY_DN28773_c0_g1_i6:207-962(-)